MERKTQDEASIQEPVVRPDLPIVDPHIHLWSRYAYFVPELLADFRSGHNVEASVYVECGMAESDDPDRAFRTVGETRYVVEQVGAAQGSGHAFAAAIVGGVDLMMGEGIGPVLDAHIAAGQGRLRGVRARVAWDADPVVGYPPIPRYPQINVVPEPAFLAGARRVADRGLTLDIWGFHTQIDDIAAFASKCPDLPIMVDHCGGPLGIGPYTDRAAVFALWSAAIRRLAAVPNVHIKLSGLGMPRMGFRFEHGRARHSAELVTAWSPYVHECLEAFGPSRSVFASNFPVDSETASYALLVNAYKIMLADLPDADMLAVLGGNARRFYGIR